MDTSEVDQDESSNSIAALGVMYQAERQDQGNLLLTALALIAGAAAYIGVAVALVNSASNPGNPWVLAFLPFPMWVVTAYHVLLVANALVRSASVEIIEKRLIGVLNLRNEEPRIGSRAAQRVMNIDEQPTVLRIQSYITYVGVGAVVVAFTVYCLTVAAKSNGWDS